MKHNHHLSRSPLPALLPAALALALACFFSFSGCTKTPEDYARIACTSADAQKRAAALDALVAANAQSQLADVAFAATDSATRIRAADKLTDEPLIAGLLKKTTDMAVAEKLFARVTSPPLLADLARNAWSEKTRLTAALNTHDQPALDGIATNPRLSAFIRQAAIMALTDQPALARIAQSNADLKLREAAIGKLTNQELLASLAQNTAGQSDVRIAAIHKLTDQRLLLRIAATRKSTDQQAPSSMAKPANYSEINSTDLEIRLAAVESITDQTLLANIIKTADADSPDGDEIDIREAAARNMTDQTMLATLARDESIMFVRHTIVGRLTDQKLLAEFAKKDSDQSVRFAAVEKLADQRLLAEIAKTDEDEEVRKTAVSKLGDSQSALADIAQTSKNIETAAAALEKLTDQPLLAGVAAKTKFRIIREDALEKITDAQHLATLARQQDGPAAAEVRALALPRLSDKTLLASAAQNDPDPLVRKIAANMLAEPPQDAPAAGPKNIQDLINAGKILVSIRGNSIERLDMTLKKTSPDTRPLEVLIPAGTYFTCDNGDAQNMVSTEDVTVVLGQQGRVISAEKTAAIPVACANRTSDIPKQHDSFVITPLPDKAGADLAKLMTTLGAKNTPYYTKQAAIWIVTDDADLDDLGTLRTVSQNEPFIPGISQGSRAINEPQAAAAMRLCAEAGVDIKKKNIWRDRAGILAKLDADELKTWLENFMKP